MLQLQVTLEWDPVKMLEKENAVLQYEVFYKMIGDNSTTADLFDGNEAINVTETSAVVHGLETGMRHHFFVIARNQGYTHSNLYFSCFFRNKYTVTMSMSIEHKVLLHASLQVPLG